MRRLLFGGFILIFSFSCSNSRRAEKNSEDQSSSKVSYSTYILASIERTACYGRCPTYKAVIFNDGKAEYTGKMNVEKIGVYESELSKEELSFILEKADEINYFELDDKYDGNITDVPVCITYMNNGNQSKEIQNRYEGPAELEEFQKYLDQILDSKEWKFVSKGEEEFQQDQD